MSYLKTLEEDADQPSLTCVREKPIAGRFICEILMQANNKTTDVVDTLCKRAFGILNYD